METKQEKRQRLRQEIEQTETIINNTIAKICDYRKVWDKYVYQLFYPNETKKLVWMLRINELHKLSVWHSDEKRNEINAFYDGFEKLINEEMKEPRQALNKYKFPWKMVEGRFLFDADEVERYVISHSVEVFPEWCYKKTI